MPMTSNPDPNSPFERPATPATPTAVEENPALSPEEQTTQRRRAVTAWLLAGVATLLLTARFPAAAQTVGIFIVTLSVLVFVHEWGHYQFARWAGMKVNRFAIGFPPFIYTKRRNGIDYSIGALPIGGMVDIAGLGSEEEMVATARGEEREAGEPRHVWAAPPNRQAPHGQKQFQDASLGWRFWTLFAGPLMNFIYAIVVFVGVYAVAGVPDKVDMKNTVESVRAGAPAELAGIRAGDNIVSINGIGQNDKKMLGQITRSEGKPLVVVVRRDKETLRKMIRPAWVLEDGQRMLVLGVNMRWESRVLTYKKVSALKAVRLGWEDTTQILASIGAFLSRAATIRLSEQDRREVGGPVKIAQVVGDSARHGLYHLALMSAALSVNLGLLNLLPIPALDGGRILFLGYELVARRPFDPNKENIAHMVGMAVLLAFMLFITMRDILPFIEKGLKG